MQNDRFEWDDRKAALNPGNHGGVTFEQACGVFADAYAIEVVDEREVYLDLNGNPEERINILGLDPAGNVLVVTFTWRGIRRRIITARKAERHEARSYDQSRRQF